MFCCSFVFSFLVKERLIYSKKANTKHLWSLLLKSATQRATYAVPN
jgi:hypothetical protein